MSGSSLVSTPEAAKALGISARTLNRYAAEGKLVPAGVLAGPQRARYRWDVEDLRRQFRELAVRQREQRDE
ncbi:helix-turn-helix domain-containing protein [Pseudonocardia sp. CA-107938]|uniref:helix-turn-helix domain-containing protein n=1 Tax=Pseudonocardia sp. CA-107938 TaxID=3240021 RepID=UPI003D94F8C8